MSHGGVIIYSGSNLSLRAIIPVKESSVEGICEIAAVYSDDFDSFVTVFYRSSLVASRIPSSVLRHFQSKFNASSRIVLTADFNLSFNNVDSNGECNLL